MKEKFLMFLPILILTAASFAQQFGISQIDNELESIEILRSTRADVEKILGRPKDGNAGESFYKTEKNRIVVYYATAPCKGNLTGWNVPRDTVLGYLINPHEYFELSSLNLNLDNFIETVDDTLEHYYTNADLGIQISAQNGYRFSSIKYLPKNSDLQMRCPDYPPYSPVSDTYYSYDSYINKDLQFGYEMVDLIDINLQNLKISRLDYKGYFLVYSGDGISDKKYEEYISKLRKYVKKNVAGGRIEIIRGTRQKLFGVVIFQLPVDYPAPVPKAPYASDRSSNE